MKRFLLLSIVALSAGVVLSQNTENEDLKKNNAFLRFEPSEYNMGTLAVNQIDDNSGNVEIIVFNDGSKPLIINQVTACCGTNVKEWPHQPIIPGQKGKIKISFRIEPKPSRISRTVTVNSNAANGNILKVAILGEVVLSNQTNEIQLP